MLSSTYISTNKHSCTERYTQQNTSTTRPTYAHTHHNPITGTAKIIRRQSRCRWRTYLLAIPQSHGGTAGDAAREKIQISHPCEYDSQQRHPKVRKPVQRQRTARQGASLRCSVMNVGMTAYRRETQFLIVECCFPKFLFTRKEFICYRVIR